MELTETQGTMVLFALGWIGAAMFLIMLEVSGLKQRLNEIIKWINKHDKV